MNPTDVQRTYRPIPVSPGLHNPYNNASTQYSPVSPTDPNLRYEPRQVPPAYGAAPFYHPHPQNGQAYAPYYPMMPPQYAPPPYTPAAGGNPQPSAPLYGQHYMPPGQPVVNESMGFFARLDDGRRPEAPPCPTKNSSSGNDNNHRQLEGRGPSLGFDINGNQPVTNIYPTIPSENRDTYPDTPLPPNSVLLWEASKPGRVYFVQQEGHVVTRQQPLELEVFKCPPMNDVSSFPIGSLAGHARNASILVKAEECWRLGLGKERSFIVRGYQGELAFFDDSTSPTRFVIVVLSKEAPKEEKQRLDVLLNASSFSIDEPSNVVEKLESGVGNAYESLTDNLDSLVKKKTPGLHKNTKWLRKGTANIVQFSGSIVSKGVHLVSDNVMEKEAPKKATLQHKALMNALKTYRNAVEKKKVAFIMPCRK